jgi:hypothetical protein
MKKYSALLSGLESRLTALDPEWEKKPFRERNELDGNIANMVTAIRCYINDISDVPESEMKEVVETIRLKVEELEDGDEGLKRYYNDHD